MRRGPEQRCGRATSGKRGDVLALPLYSRPNVIHSAPSLLPVSND